MARFLSIEEIGLGLIPTADTIGLLAERISQLEGFGKRFVTFGSAAWVEEQTWRWRSDIDQLHGVLNDFDWPEIRPVFEGVFGDNCDLAMRSIIQVLPFEAGGLVSVRSGGMYPTVALSPSTRDHFKLLAARYGGAWKNILSQVKPVPGRRRIADIEEHVHHVRTWIWSKVDWATGFRGPLDPSELLRMSSIENFPKQLMRKLLGWMGKLPSPDTLPNIIAAFRTIDFRWAHRLTELFASFYQIDASYDALMADVKACGLNSVSYEQRLRGLFKGLPVNLVCDIVNQLCMHHKLQGNFELPGF